MPLYRMDDQTRSAFILGIFIGAVVGLSIGILFL